MYTECKERKVNRMNGKEMGVTMNGKEMGVTMNGNETKST